MAREVFLVAVEVVHGKWFVGEALEEVVIMCASKFKSSLKSAIHIPNWPLVAQYFQNRRSSGAETNFQEIEIILLIPFDSSLLKYYKSLNRFCPIFKEKTDVF
jgi:hypothetical protein